MKIKALVALLCCASCSLVFVTEASADRPSYADRYISGISGIFDDWSSSYDEDGMLYRNGYMGYVEGEHTTWPATVYWPIDFGRMYYYNASGGAGSEMTDPPGTFGIVYYDNSQSTGSPDIGCEYHTGKRSGTTWLVDYASWSSSNQSSSVQIATANLSSGIISGTVESAWFECNLNKGERIYSLKAIY